jgi:hypothetical protein
MIPAPPAVSATLIVLWHTVHRNPFFVAIPPVTDTLTCVIWIVQIFLPPLLLDSAVRIDFFLFKKVGGMEHLQHIVSLVHL